MSVTQLSRRQFLSRVGTLAVGFSLAPALAQLLASDVGAAAGDPDLKVDGWIEIGPDNRVTIYSGKVELGTGVETALTQIVTEELFVGFDQVNFVQGDTARTPDQGYTAGSKTIQNQGPLLRIAAATAFQALFAMAVQQLGMPAQSLRAKNGKIGIGANQNRGLTYAQLIGQQQLVLPSDPNVTVVNPNNYQIVGESVPRVDIPAKVAGRYTYIHDLEVPGMVHGHVIRPAGRNAKLVSVDDSGFASLAGSPRLVRNQNFVGIVATDEYAVMQAVRSLTQPVSTPAKIQWQQGQPLIPQASLPQALEDPTNLYSLRQENKGDVDAALAGAAHALSATYFTPFHMHAAMGPSCAIADVRGAPDPATGIQATIWAGTQGVGALRGAIAELLGLTQDKVRIIYVEAAGCYGHNGADDVAGDAALLSQAVGKPVRVQWTRQEEHGWEPLGPAMLHKMRGGVDASGGLVAWEHSIFTPVHNARPGGRQGMLLAGQAIGKLPQALGPSSNNSGARNGPVTYDFANNRLIERQAKTFEGSGVVGSPWTPTAPLTYRLPRTTALRSLGGFSNSFANESFLDELAARGGQDPLAFRLRYSGDPRAVAVLEAMAKQADWQKKLPAAPSGWRRGRGIAYLRYETVEAYVATYAEVLVNPADGKVRVVRVVVAHDCGLIINPDGLRNQIEGNAIQGISRTLNEEVLYNSFGVTSTVWALNPPFVTTPQYTPIAFADIPSIEIVLIDRPEEVAWGAGEPVIGTLPGAIGNAIFDATGARLRTLPITPERVLAAIAAAN